MRFLKPVATALALTVGALSFATSAEAGHRYHHRHHHHGGAAALGLFGFAAGAMIGSALSQPRYGAPSYYYYEPAPVYAPPPVVYRPAPVYSAQVTPWSPEWYAYCEDRYVSFNSRTGHFLGFDGQYHFCR